MQWADLQADTASFQLGVAIGRENLWRAAARPATLDPVTAKVVELGWRFDHIGIPTTAELDEAITLPHLGITVTDHRDNPVGIQWQRYHPDADYPDIVKTVAHVGFEVDDLASALQDQTLIIEPNSPSPGVLVAFIEVRGAPVELLQVDHEQRPDLGPTSA